MSFLLDTCVLSDLTRPHPNGGVVRWFDVQDAAALFVSALTVGEIEQGVAALPAGRKKGVMASWLATLRSTYAARVLPFDAPVAAIWGRTAARLARSGHGVGVVDGLIAATALHNGYTVTRKARDFEPTGVPVLNLWPAS